MFVSFITHTPLFFWARGNISISPMRWWKLRVHKGKDVVQDIDPDGRKRRSIGMIVSVSLTTTVILIGSDVINIAHSYPIVFAIVTLPLSVVRWRTGFGSTQRSLPTATFAVEIIYSLSGALNVLLFLITRSQLLLPRNLSAKRNRTGVAPSITLAEGKAEITELIVGGLEARQRQRGHEPVPLGSLPREDDMDWRMPMAEHYPE